MTSRTPPAYKVFPIFLWLKIKEIALFLMWLVGLALIIIAMFFLLEYGLEITLWLGSQAWMDYIVYGVGSVGFGTIIIYLIYLWLRSNWQQATRIAMAGSR